LAAAGSANPTSIVGTAFLATIVSTIVGIGTAKLFEKFRSPNAEATAVTTSETAQEEKQNAMADVEVFVEPPKTTARGKCVLVGFLALFAYFFLTYVLPDLRLQKLLPNVFPEVATLEV